MRQTQRGQRKRCEAQAQRSRAAGQSHYDCIMHLNHCPLRYARHSANRSLTSPHSISAFLSVIVIALAGCSVTPAQRAAALSDRVANNTLPPLVSEKLRAAQIPDNAIGAVALRVSDGAVVWAHRAAQPMQPASTMKVLTSIVALDTLRPTYRGRTELRSAGDIRSGALHGDIVLTGFANPDFDWQALQAMLVTLKHRGVKDIRGDLILDRTFFRPARPDVGAQPFDESPEFRYNVIPDALLVNTHLQQLEMTTATDAMTITATPALDGVTFVSQMRLSDKPCADWEDTWAIPVVTTDARGEIQVALQGEFPKQCAITTEISVLDRTVFSERLFRTLWRSLGGTLQGAAREGATHLETKLLAEHQSRTLAEFNRDILKRSDNPVTRLTYLTLGALASDRRAHTAPSTTAASAEVVIRDWLKQKNISDAGLTLDNGSGLSRSERIAPITLAQTLRAAHASAWAPEFLSVLPIAGVDGGIKNRLVEPALAGRARLKTGTLRDVTALAGFVSDASGETYAVVAMLNHPLSVGRVGRPIVDAVMEWVASTDLRAAHQ
jgi:serine-type D-Ala-D-Ala carboxypeptidase/endopeptidase (penicillin-binding protein 4)